MIFIFFLWWRRGFSSFFFLNFFIVFSRSEEINEMLREKWGKMWEIRELRRWKVKKERKKKKKNYFCVEENYCKFLSNSFYFCVMKIDFFLLQKLFSTRFCGKYFGFISKNKIELLPIIIFWYPNENFESHFFLCGSRVW